MWWLSRHLAGGLLAMSVVSLLQAAELQRHADASKALQEELRTLRKASKQHEEARSKAEVSRVGLRLLF
jgi:hypothetical protein